MADTEIITKKLTKEKIKEPPRYKVILLNDDVTTMEFVVALLMSVFRHNEASAVSLTMQIHNDGSAVAGIYTHEIAEQKVLDATSIARNNGYPLIIKAEQE
jgi:ATP-dependent Clp protease adaptor protein ClpS